MLENEMLYEVVLGHALAAHGTLVPVGFSVTSERRSSPRCCQTRHGSKKRGHEHQSKQHHAAPESAEKARARTVLRKTNVLRHLAFARVAEGVEVDDVGKVLAAQLEVNFRAVLVVVHLDGDEEHALCVGDGARATVLVALHVAGAALDVDVTQHDRGVVAVGGLARNSVRFSAGHGQCEHGQHQHQQRLAHGGRCRLELIKG